MRARVIKKIAKKKFDNNSSVFDEILSPVFQIIETLDLGELRTGEFKIRQIFEKKFNSYDTKAVVSFAIIDTFKNTDLASFAKESNREIKKKIKEFSKDERFTTFLRMLNDAEKMYPNVGILILLQENPVDMIFKASETHDLINEFKKLKGEKAARCAVRIYREVAEFLYVNYVHAVFEFVQILEGEKDIKSTLSFGVMLKQLPARLERLGYSDLLAMDASLIRNATCHTHWKYNAADDNILFWNKNKTLERQLTSGELFEKAMAMYDMVTENYYNIIQLHFKQKIFNDWLTIFRYVIKKFDQVVKGNPLINEYLEKQLAIHFEKVLQLRFTRI